MIRNFARPITVLNAVSATGVGRSVLATDYRHKEVTLATAGMGAGDTITVKVSGSFEETAPDFSASRTATNLWDYIQIFDLESGEPIDGDTGVTFSGANDVRMFSINMDGLRWITLEVTTLSDTTNTSVTGIIYMYND